jgi:prevent-host-death family protein
VSKLDFEAAASKLLIPTLVVMTEIESLEAETHFGDLIQRVRDCGEKFIVTERGEPVATILPLEGKPRLKGEDRKALFEEPQSG